MEIDRALADELLAKALAVWNEGNYDLVADAYVADFKRLEPGDPLSETRQSFIDHVKKRRAQYPDMKIIAEETILEHDRMVLVWRFEGTDIGDMPERRFPLSGKHIDFKGVSISHVRDGKIADEYVYYDQMEVLEKMGFASMMAA